MSRLAARSASWGLRFGPPSRLTSDILRPRADPRCGSQGDGATCDSDPLNTCCSQYGHCGNSSEFCQISQGCQSGCIDTFSPTNGRCGAAFGGALCKDGCCSKNGYCGSTDDYCLVDNECQSGCKNRSDDKVGSASAKRSLSHPAKIGIITAGVIFGVCLILLSLYIVWRCRRRRQKAFNLGSDLGSGVVSILDPAPAVVEIANQRPNRVCVGCSQTKLLAAFPSRRTTTSCNHEPGFCRQCLQVRISVSLAQDGWEQLRCPENECHAQLEEADVQEFASLDDHQRYLAERRGAEIRECRICATRKTFPTEFPNRAVTDGCLHPPACRDCIISTIRVAIEEGRWTHIICPLCPNQLEFKDVADFAANEDSARYHRLSARHAKEQIPNFRWCLSGNCDSGQIHAPGKQLVRCNACGYEMCSFHQRPWHTGLTCREFSKQNAQQLRLEEAAVREVIQRTTKPCPKCKIKVEKIAETCSHMTCRPPMGCCHEFCYECLVKWTGYGRKTKHQSTCSSYVTA